MGMWRASGIRSLGSGVHHPITRPGRPRHAFEGCGELPVDGDRD